jgi:hypothetical protein
MVANFHKFDGKAVLLQFLFQPASSLAAGRGHGECLCAKAGQNARRIDAAAARREIRRQNVGAIFEHQPVYRHDAVDCRIHSQREDRIFHRSFPA